MILGSPANECHDNDGGGGWQHSLVFPLNQSTNQSTQHNTTNQSINTINQSTQSISQSTQSTSHTINRINQSINRINQSINRINQSINQSTQSTQSINLYNIRVFFVAIDRGWPVFFVSFVLTLNERNMWELPE
jgi:glutaredoxin 2